MGGRDFEAVLGIIGGLGEGWFSLRVVFRGVGWLVVFKKFLEFLALSVRFFFFCFNFRRMIYFGLRG